ncbi:aromatic acid/H+ symport family MFS transporter [Ochrobactrum pecoris]|uniref:AAHS family benzoate transporter-like MFS transporter n=1 Tax=Brucella pecoris TaxID=867683 RepID=A0A5C5CX72_9HYPH|nr:MFS transporter [Brucella pecoris]MBB4091920.1 AAHS family benzoate transporter-like MFS transporter [Brucella pecoris]NKW82270.1 aromatic acid/H+ symport family MFS transporter [Brucella pecoris]TNV15624.1 aromatic acid/H+ symport family MFS transporter [Brucella pecoris]
MSQAQSIDAPAMAGREISAGKSLLVVGLCWLAIFAEGYDVGVIGAILPALSVDPVWQLTPIELGAIGSYTVIGMLIGGILAGTLSELHGRKPLFIACITVFSLCMIVSAMAPTPFIFGLSRFISGIGLGGIIPVAAALTVEYSPVKKKSFNYGLMYSGYSMGLLAAALCGRGFLEAHGWRTIVLIGAVPLLFVPIFLAFLPESVESLVQRGKHDAARKTAQRMGVGVPAAIVRKHGKVGWRTVFSEIFSPKNAFETACFWAALFMGLLLVYGLAQWLPQIMRKNGYDLGNSLLFLAVFSLSSAIGGIVLGTWADRFGVKRTVACSYALGALGIVALAFKGSLLMNYVFVAIAGFGTVSASLVLTGFLAQRLDSSIRSAGTGWALSFSRIGALSGPLLGGLIASLNVSPQWNFYIFAIVAALAAVATALIPSRSTD